MGDTPVKTIPTLESLRERRTEIIALAEKYKAYNVRVFGSVARGDATPESDIDFLVSAREGVSIFDLVGLWLDLRDLLEMPVSLLTDDTYVRREELLKRILIDAVAL